VRPSKAELSARPVLQGKADADMMKRHDQIPTTVYSYCYYQHMIGMGSDVWKESGADHSNAGVLSGYNTESDARLKST